MNIGFGEMLFLFVLGLLLFGPKKLPEIGRHLGKAMNDFKRASHEFQTQLNEEVRILEETAKVTEPEVVPPSGTSARGSGEFVDYNLEPNSGEHEGQEPKPARTGESIQ
jgi:Tat protein translocase TatB subunit